MGNNLAALLKEPPMQNVEDPSQGALPLSLVVSSTSGGALTTTSTVTTAASRTSSPSPSPSPKSTPPPPSTGPSGAPTASSPIALSNNSPIPGKKFLKKNSIISIFCGIFFYVDYIIFYYS